MRCFVHSVAISPLFAIVFLAANGAHAEPQFLQYFPNSSAIDGNGCVNCHFNAGGGGSRNGFGNAMSNAGFDWSSVCHLDSDGDGQTNGQELGDPDCIWTSGAAERSTAISNPGKASSTSSNPNGGSHAGGEGEGEGSAGEGEGEGEGQSGDVNPACPAHASSSGGACTCASGFVADSAGTSCVAGTSGTWQCDPTWRGDGSCDCGCGAPDPDCADNTLGSCAYNDCDTWQTTQGLQPEQNDPTQCQGGTTSGSTTVAGQCPANANAAGGGGCTCAPGFAPSADHASCISASSGCPAHSTPQNNSCACDAGYTANASGTGCVPSSTGEGEGEGVHAGEGEGEGAHGEGEGEGDVNPTYMPQGCAATELGPLGALALLGLVFRARSRRR